MIPRYLAVPIPPPLLLSQPGKGQGIEGFCMAMLGVKRPSRHRHLDPHDLIGPPAAIEKASNE